MPTDNRERNSAGTKEGQGLRLVELSGFTRAHEEAPLCATDLLGDTYVLKKGGAWDEKRLQDPGNIVACLVDDNEEVIPLPSTKHGAGRYFYVKYVVSVTTRSSRPKHPWGRAKPIPKREKQAVKA